MKPLGTITICFPHVDEETRSMLQSVMDEAENFGVFTETLCEKVYSEHSSPLLKYFAFFFSFHIQNYNLTDRLETVGKVSDIARPLYLISMTHKGDTISWEKMKHSLIKAIRAAPNDWIASHLYLTWRLRGEPFFPEVDTDVKPIELITSSVHINKELEFFKSYLMQIKARSYYREDKIQESIELEQEALAILRKYDEQILVANILYSLGNKSKHTDLKRAIDILLTARELSETLGYKYLLALIQHEMGHITALRGEFDAAIQHQSEYINYLNSLGHNSVFVYSIIAHYYNQMKQGRKALENAIVGSRIGRGVARLSAYFPLQIAWALINLRRFDEAKTKLAEAHQIALKSGDSNVILWCRAVDCILDKAENNFETAIECFEEVLKDYKESPTPLWQNPCYLNLTEMEIEMLSEESLKEKTESSGPWMQELEQYVQNYDLPGIAAQTLLLKAKLCHRQGQFDEVRKILKEVKKRAEAPSMRYLNDLAISMFPDIIVI
ncbi:MAG: hypothetical protein AM326_10365 [Candidatus Thorarchaeota archaeon SMTZ-45]|nr:MAG: hypothetical protein AM326_10365 [Candidatus Thorarchaeota archaeon SMTZ-45]